MLGFQWAGCRCRAECGSKAPRRIVSVLVLNDKQQIVIGPNADGLLFIAAKEAAKRAARQYRGRTGEQDEAITAVVLCVVVAEAVINRAGQFFEVPAAGSRLR